MGGTLRAGEEGTFFVHRRGGYSVIRCLLLRDLHAMKAGWKLQKQTNVRNRKNLGVDQQQDSLIDTADLRSCRRDEMAAGANAPSGVVLVGEGAVGRLDAKTN